MAFGALLTGGAATAFLLFGSVTGQVGELGGAAGAAAVVSGALLGSVFALSAFLAGIRILGPGTASLLVTIEVPAGLLFAALALGERLTQAQLGGAALVVGGDRDLAAARATAATRRLVQAAPAWIARTSSIVSASLAGLSGR